MTVSLGWSNRSIEVSLDDYLRMSDQDFNDLIAQEQGYTLNHPFINSVLPALCGEKEDPESDEEETDETLFSDEEIEEMVSNDSFGTC